MPLSSVVSSYLARLPFDHDKRAGGAYHARSGCPLACARNSRRRRLFIIEPIWRLEPSLILLELRLLSLRAMRISILPLVVSTRNDCGAFLSRIVIVTVHSTPRATAPSSIVSYPLLSLSCLDARVVCARHRAIVQLERTGQFLPPREPSHLSSPLPCFSW